MAGKTHRAALSVSGGDLELIETIASSRSEPMRRILRAKILVGYRAGRSIVQIAADVQTTRDTVYKCVDKGLEMGIAAALEDLPHSPRSPVITPEAKTWVVSLACSKPKEHGYAAELWTRQSLADQVRKLAVAQAHPSLEHAAKATIHRILDEQQIKPHKVRYYLEKRDSEFKEKMREVLVIYKELELFHQGGSRPRDAQSKPIITISVDEKPGVQALANTAADLPPVPGQHPSVGRDYEYKRMGTCSILAGLDLQDGHVCARVERKHRSREFVALLKDLDSHYPQDAVLRILLDKPFGAHFQRNTRLSGHAAEPLHLRPHAQARFLAQSRGDSFWKNGPHLSEIDPG